MTLSVGYRYFPLFCRSSFASILHTMFSSALATSPQAPIPPHFLRTHRLVDSPAIPLQPILCSLLFLAMGCLSPAIFFPTIPVFLCLSSPPPGRKSVFYLTDLKTFLLAQILPVAMPSVLPSPTSLPISQMFPRPTFRESVRSFFLPGRFFFFRWEQISTVKIVFSPPYSQLPPLPPVRTGSNRIFSLFELLYSGRLPDTV